MERYVGPFSDRVVTPLRVGGGHRRGPTKAQVRGPAWRRTSKGFFVPTDTPPTPEQRIAEASVVLTPGTAVTGWAALRWMGGRWFTGDADGGRTELPVDLVAMCRQIRSQAGIRVSQERLTPADVVEHDGLRVTVAERSVCFLMRYAASVTAAVVAADMAACSDLVTTAGLAAYVLAHPGWTGIPLARRALPLVSENSWSPMESRLRVLCTGPDGLPSLLANPAVFDSTGRHVATPDLLEPDAGLAIEYDGADHLARAQRHRDVGREEAMRDLGLECVTVLREHLAEPARLLTRLRRAHDRASGKRRTTSWTLTPPAWWTPLDDVASRRAAAVALAG